VKKVLVLVCLFSCFTFVCAWGESGLLDEADKLIRTNKLDEASTLLKNGLTTAETGVEKAEICWRLARATYAAAETKKRNKVGRDIILRDFEQGAAWADEAVKADRNSYQAYFWRASNWGSWVQLKGDLEALAKISQMKDDLAAALRIKSDFATAYYVLGLLYANVPGWPISFGNKEFALSFFRRAIEVAEKPEASFGYYLNLAAGLWERNWMNADRKTRWAGMLAKYTSKSDAADKYCFFEGAIASNSIPAHSPVSLETISDREEAKAIFGFLEKQVQLLIEKSAERDQYLKAIASVREKCR
jgi:tetratricopeptide (TPR) repeat protein